MIRRYLARRRLRRTHPLLAAALSGDLDQAIEEKAREILKEMGIDG